MKKKPLIILILIIILIIVVLAITISSMNKKEENEDQAMHSYNADAGEQQNLSDFNLSISNIEKIENKISDTEELMLMIKEYAYQNGIIEGDNLSLKEMEENGEKIKLKFEMNDESKTKIIVTVKTVENTYSFSNYK